MKYYIKLAAIGLGLLLILWNVNSQQAQPPVNPYYFDGNEVVFVFDIRTYAKALEGPKADKVDFKDLNIYEVAITGQFNDWSKEGWKMHKRGEYIFELRKHVEDFNQPFPLEFKYIINGKFITAPEGVNANSKQFSDDFLEEVYKLDMSVLRISEMGNTLFQLKGHHDAKEVILTGSFNGWDERAVKMLRGAQGWYLQADLPPGKYEYKFIVDGEWKHDPAAKENNGNEHGTLNSVLYVKKPITFNLEGFGDAKRVILTGSFEDWNESKHKMVLENGVWTITLPLTGGKHHYKFIIDGQWHLDPANPIIEDDGYGNLNSVLFVH